MSISNVSAYQQLQSWHAAQRSATDKLMGSSGASTLVDNSYAFTDITSGYDSALAGITLQNVLSRVQNKLTQSAAANASTVDLNAGVNAAKSAGSALLAQLGLAGGSSTHSSSSGAYTAPVDAATGYSYVKTTAASVSTLGALNFLA